MCNVVQQKLRDYIVYAIRVAVCDFDIKFSNVC